MKKLFLATFFLCIATLGIQAQIVKPHQGKAAMKSIHNGVNESIKTLDQNIHPTGTHNVWDGYIYPRLGINLSTLLNMGGNPKISLSGGVGIEVFVLPRLGIDMELNYSHQGTAGIYTKFGNTVSGPYDYRLDYFSTTFLARWYPKATMPLSVYSGISLSNCVNAKSELKNGTTTSLKDDHIRSGDFSIPIGTSYEVGQWAFDLRYYASFLHIAKSEKAKRIMGNATNMRIEATIAYKILFL